MPSDSAFDTFRDKNEPILFPKRTVPFFKTSRPF